MERLREELESATEEEILLLTAYDTAKINDASSICAVLDSYSQLEQIKHRHDRLIQILSRIDGRNES